VAGTAHLAVDLGGASLAIGTRAGGQPFAEGIDGARKVVLVFLASANLPPDESGFGAF
jgi:hypothetical protein